MKVKNQIINTSNIPSTVSILQKSLPSILLSKCYNEAKFPFYKEVRKTEIGHLFEHILIEYLCMLKIVEGYDYAVYTGLTKWNWYSYPMGTFHITISANINESAILAKALEKSITLIDVIFSKSINNKHINNKHINQDKLVSNQSLH